MWHDTFIYVRCVSRERLNCNGRWLQLKMCRIHLWVPEPSGLFTPRRFHCPSVLECVFSFSFRLLLQHSVLLFTTFYILQGYMDGAIHGFQSPLHRLTSHCIPLKWIWAPLFVETIVLSVLSNLDHCIDSISVHSNFHNNPQVHFRSEKSLPYSAIKCYLLYLCFSFI